MSNENERREFLKVAGAALGGITMTMAAGEASAQPAAGEMKAATTMVKPSRMTATRTATFRCSREVKVEELVEALKVALGRGGCPACGLLGLDIVFHQGDPVERLGAQLKGVNEATFG